MNKFSILFACAIAFAGCAKQGCVPSKSKPGSCKKSQSFTCDPNVKKPRKQRTS